MLPANDEAPCAKVLQNLLHLQQDRSHLAAGAAGAHAVLAMLRGSPAGDAWPGQPAWPDTATQEEIDMMQRLLRCDVFLQPPADLDRWTGSRRKRGTQQQQDGPVIRASLSSQILVT